QYFSSRRTDTLTHLGAGLYKLSVTDADGCTGFSNGVLIKEKDPYTYTITEIKNNLCQMDTSGAITIKVDGAVEPKGISWNGGLYAGSQIDRLINGSYRATVIDANNCVLDVLPVIISSESDITTNPIIQNEKNNGVNGEICVFPTGGFLPYKFIWNNGSSNDCIYNLKAGTYSVTITDNKNCAFTETYKVENTSGTDDEKDDFYLYPNPTTDYLYIRSNQKINEIKIFDINGRLVRSIVDLNDRISIQDLVQGVYILQLNSVKGSYLFKLLKN
ncbi:MAG: T9SS type A sorting domain-containing protein, partial [Saprospiraceae bacterium]